MKTKFIYYLSPSLLKIIWGLFNQTYNIKTLQMCQGFVSYFGRSLKYVMYINDGQKTIFGHLTLVF